MSGHDTELDDVVDQQALPDGGEDEQQGLLSTRAQGRLFDVGQSDDPPRRPTLYAADGASAASSACCCSLVRFVLSMVPPNLAISGSTRS